jgi:hypothetical protein
MLGERSGPEGAQHVLCALYREGGRVKLGASRGSTPAGRSAEVLGPPAAWSRGQSPT